MYLDWLDAQTDLRERYAQMRYCWFCFGAAHFTVERPSRQDNSFKKSVAEEEKLLIGFMHWKCLEQRVSER